MSWNTFHDRGEILREVVRVADDRRDGALPMSVPGVAENFTDEVDLLGALLLRWHAQLFGNIERATADEPMNIASAVAMAWRTTAEQLPGVRLVLDRSIEQPLGADMEEVLIRARRREWAHLAAVAGLANGEGAAAVAAGRRVEGLARAGLPVPTATAVEDATRPQAVSEPGPQGPATEPAESLADRIKAVLAA